MKKITFDSRHAPGPAYDKTYALPPQCVKCARPSERIEVSCHAFQASYAWNSVNATNNAFTLTGAGAPVAVVLGVGNYTFEELACTITDALVDAGLVGAEVTYLRPYNKLHFELPEAMTLSFDNASYRILGFAADAVPVGTALTSTAAIDLSPIDSVWVCLEGVTMVGDGCLANWKGEVKPAPILFTLPIAPAPFQKLDYTGPADAGFSVPLVDRELRTIRLVMCDGNGEPLTDFPDYTITLVVRVVDAHLANMDRNIADILRHVKAASENYGAEFVMRHMEQALEYLSLTQDYSDCCDATQGDQSHQGA